MIPSVMPAQGAAAPTAPRLRQADYSVTAANTKPSETRPSSHQSRFKSHRTHTDCSRTEALTLSITVTMSVTVVAVDCCAAPCWRRGEGATSRRAGMTTPSSNTACGGGDGAASQCRVNRHALAHILDTSRPDGRQHTARREQRAASEECWLPQRRPRPPAAPPTRGKRTIDWIGPQGHRRRLSLCLACFLTLRRTREDENAARAAPGVTSRTRSGDG